MSFRRLYDVQHGRQNDVQTKVYLSQNNIHSTFYDLDTFCFIPQFLNNQVKVKYQCIFLILGNTREL